MTLTTEWGLAFVNAFKTVVVLDEAPENLSDGSFDSE